MLDWICERKLRVMLSIMCLLAFGAILSASIALALGGSAAVLMTLLFYAIGATPGAVIGLVMVITTKTN